MKLAIQYLHDAKGTAQAVQLPISEWEKVLGKIRKYEQTLKLKSDFKEAFDQVSAMRKSKVGKQTLNEFLNEL